MKQFYFFTLIFLFFVTFLNAQGNRIYVRANASGTQTGTTWNDAFSNLNAAMSAAEAEDTIWVAAGTYKPTALNDRNASFPLKSKVRMYGGFSGTETALAQRDWNANQTVLSGDIGAPGDSSDNSFTILYLENPDTGTVIDGFRFEYGIANDTSSNPYSLVPSKCGGAIFVQAPGNIAYPDIVNCTFYRNYALYNGGAVYVFGDYNGSVAPRFINCIFEENRCGYSGGAVNRYGGSLLERAPDFSNCRFIGNQSGGYQTAVLWTDGPGKDTMQMEHCVFENNSGGVFYSLGRPTGMKCIFNDVELNNTGRGILIYGFDDAWVDFARFNQCRFYGGIGRGLVVNADSAPEGKGKVTIDSCLFDLNYYYTTPTGSTYILDFGGLDSVLISDCTFSRNEANGIINSGYIRKGMRLRNLHFVANKNPLITCGTQENAMFSIENCLFERNQFTLGATYFGGAPQLTVQNCTFARNSVSTPISSFYYSSPVAFSNCAFWKNQNYDAHIFKNHTQGVRFEHCYFDTLKTSALPAYITLGGGNIIGGSPLFANMNQNGGDYHLQACSPLINAGKQDVIESGETDLGGFARIQGGKPDIGAYERSNFALGGAPVVASGCTVGSGLVMFDPINGCAPYTYHWEQAGLNGNATTDLQPGLYNFTITDGVGQELEETVVIPDLFQVAPVAGAVDCASGTPGFATFTTAGGTGPFRYGWDNGLSDSVLVNLHVGDYTVTVTDHYGCEDSTVVQVGITGTVPLTAMVTPISCFGNQDGIIQVGSPTGVTLAYTWAQGFTIPFIEGLAAGFYSVTATDVNGCTGSLDSIQVSEPTLLSFEIAMLPASDHLSNDGAIWIDTISGGTPPYHIAWNIGQTGDTLQQLIPDIYIATVTDAAGCTATQVIELTFYTGTSNAEQAAGFKIFPNPTSGITQILFEQAMTTPGQLFVTNTLGQLLQKTDVPAGRQSILLDISSLSEGIYWLEFRTVSDSPRSAGFVPLLKN
jgi:hypothetical protein